MVFRNSPHTTSIGSFHDIQAMATIIEINVEPAFILKIFRNNQLNVQTLLRSLLPFHFHYLINFMNEMKSFANKHAYFQQINDDNFV